MEEVKLVSKPFTATCQINNNNKNQKIEVALEVAGKQVCFEIADQYCRLRQVDCNPVKPEIEKNL